MTEENKRELFLNSQFEANSFQIGQVRINSSVLDIDQSEIVDIFVDHKGYEQLKFADRLELLIKKIGWVHYASGASFNIVDGAVKQIKLSSSYLQNNKTSKKELISIFGQPDDELVDDICYSGFEYNIDAYILVYRQKLIYAFIDPKTEILKELHFGTIDENIYGQKNNPITKKIISEEEPSWWQKFFKWI